MKIAVIGGSSYYTPGLIEALNASDISVEVVLNGRSEEKLQDVVKVCKSLAKDRVQVTFSTDLEESLEGADVVLQQVRVGGMKKRGEDERFPLSLGVIGEETIVPGGASLAVRTIPYMREFARVLKKVAPKAKVVVLTNPNNMVIDYLNRYEGVDAIGFCDLPTSLFRGIVEVFSGEKKDVSDIYKEITFKYYGINHLAFVGDIEYKGERIDLVTLAPKLGLDRSLVDTLGLIPVSYLKYYYYTRSLVEKAQKGPTRGEVLLKQEEKLKEEYHNSEGKKPETLKEREVPWYRDVVIPYLRAVNGQERTIAVTQNKGALSCLRDDSVAELPVIITNGQVERVYQGDIPPVIRGLIVSVSESERLIVDACATQSRRLFLQGLLSHPLVREIEIAENLLGEIKRVNLVEWL